MTMIALAAFAAGLIATLVLASLLTPSRWWRRPNARALAILAAGTWAIGSALLWLVQPPTAMAAAPVARAASQTFRVYQALNLRAGRGVNARRVAVVPAGANVTTTGVVDGDWWQVNTRVDGVLVTGWASSLWLRQPREIRESPDQS